MKLEKKEIEITLGKGATFLCIKGTGCINDVLVKYVTVEVKEADMIAEFTDANNKKVKIDAGENIFYLSNLISVVEEMLNRE